MDLKTKVEAFLCSEDYSFSYGLELYEQIFGNKGELSKYKYTSFVPGSAKERLKELLGEGLQLLSYQPSFKKQKDGKNEKPLVVKYNTSKVGSEPNKIKQIREALKQTYKRSSFIHSQLVSEAQGGKDEEILLELAIKMMEEIQPEIDDYSDQLKHFEQTGKIKGQKSLEADEALKVSKKINSLRSSISRYRRLAKQEKEALKIDFYERKINELKEKLNTSQLELDNL